MVDPLSAVAPAAGKVGAGLSMSLAKSLLFLPRVAWRTCALAKESGTRVSRFAIVRVLFDQELRRCLVENRPLTTGARAALAKVPVVGDAGGPLSALETALRRATAGQLSVRDWQERQHLESRYSATESAAGAQAREAPGRYES